MPAIRLILDGDGAVADLAGKRDTIIHLPDPTLTLIRLPHGMRSGATSLVIRIELPDGRAVLAETSLAAWQMATAGLKGAELRDGRPWEGS